jgi:F-type H+-transporting ATPase subunit b
MSIDWITVTAQIANFMVLIWLLKRFLYRPILDGIDARERQIAERMGEAAHIRDIAEAREAEYKTQIADLSASRSEMLGTARRAAEQERDALLQQARLRLEAERSEQDLDRIREADTYTADLHKSGAMALLDLTRKAVADLADETLERRIVQRAASQLVEMGADLKTAGGDTREAVALTRDPLPQEVQTRLRADLAAALPGCTLRFETDAAQSAGLTLRLGGAQVGWTVDSYLDGLMAALEERTRRPLHKDAGRAV